MTLSAEEIIDLLDLEPLPHEGGFVRRTHIDDHSGAIYYLMTPDGFSAMHELTLPELWHFYGGAPVEMLLLKPDGAVETPTLGADLAAGQRPQVWVDAGVPMGASTTGDWSLVGTTMAPPYTDDCFMLSARAELVATWPGATDRIDQLTR